MLMLCAVSPEQNWSGFQLRGGHWPTQVPRTNADKGRCALDGSHEQKFVPVAHSDGFHSVEGPDLLRKLRNGRGPAYKHGLITRAIACGDLSAQS